MTFGDNSCIAPPRLSLESIFLETCEFPAQATYPQTTTRLIPTNFRTDSDDGKPIYDPYYVIGGSGFQSTYEQCVRSVILPLDDSS